MLYFDKYSQYIRVCITDLLNARETILKLLQPLLMSRLYSSRKGRNYSSAAVGNVWIYSKNFYGCMCQSCLNEGNTTSSRSRDGLVF